jgi:hypothetical protein
MGTTLSKIWKRSKVLAVLFFLAIIFILIPTWVFFKLFKKPIAFIWKRSHCRFKYAFKELFRRSKAHYKKVGQEWSDAHKSKSKERTANPPAQEISAAKMKKQKAQLHKRPILAPIHIRLKNALSSRSLPLLIQTCSEVLNELYPKMPTEMPQTHQIISNIPIFFDDAKAVRQRKIEGEIGRTLQHEILAEKWKSYFGEGIGAKILEEIPKNGKKEKGEKLAGEAKTVEQEKDRMSNVAENDADADVLLEAGEVLDRWFSWGGSNARTWEESRAHHNVGPETGSAAA